MTYTNQYQVETEFSRSYGKNITLTNNYVINHIGFKIKYVQCRITGKFVKHSLVKTELMLLQIERYKTMLVLFLWVLANVIGLTYLGSF